MVSFVIVVGLVMIWMLVIRLATVRRFRARSTAGSAQSSRPSIQDYEKTLKWFSEYLEPHLMFLAAIAVGLFTYRLARTQNKILERQVAMDESRQPVTFHFKRSESYDYRINGITENIVVSANKGYVTNLSFNVKHYLAISVMHKIGERAFEVDQVILVSVNYYFDREITYVEESTNMVWRSEDRFQEMQKIVENGLSYLAEAYDHSETDYSRRLIISASYTSFDLTPHTDYYLLSMQNFGGEYDDEFNESIQVAPANWDSVQSEGSISFLHPNWEDTAAELREIIDEQMNLPEATPQST